METIDDWAFASTDFEIVNLPKSVNKLGTYCFCRNYNLTQLTLPEGIEEIPESAFGSCYKLEKIIVPGNVKKICEHAFGLCQAKEILLSYGIEHIGWGAFCGAEVEELVLPASLRQLDAKCFGDNAHLRRVYCMATIPPVCTPGDPEDSYQGPFHGSMTEVTLYVPKGCRESYRQAWQWNKFIEIVETDEWPEAGVKTLEAESDDMKNSGKIYDFSGQEVLEPVHGQIYIVNGKKILYDD